jgi:subtilisin family serine protease
MPVKISDAGTAPVSDIARGITWAADNGAEVINVSW